MRRRRARVASAGISAYRTLGGALLLDTVGGAIETVARARSPRAVALGATTVLVNGLAGALAIGLAQSAAGGRPHRFVRLANGVASAILCVWGGADVVAGALVLSGAEAPSAEVNPRRLHPRAAHLPTHPPLS